MNRGEDVDLNDFRCFGCQQVATGAQPFNCISIAFGIVFCLLLSVVTSTSAAAQKEINQYWCPNPGFLFKFCSIWAGLFALQHLLTAKLEIFMSLCGFVCSKQGDGWKWLQSMALDLVSLLLWIAEPPCGMPACILLIQLQLFSGNSA